MTDKPTAEGSLGKLLNLLTEYPPAWTATELIALAKGLANRAADAECEVTRLRKVIAQHDLCHDLHGKVGAGAFARGCATEQRRIYGCAPDADEVVRLRRLLDRDHTGLAAALSAILKTLRGYSWLAESNNRGMYSEEEWSEDTLREEVYNCLDQIEAVAATALQRSGTLADCAFSPSRPEPPSDAQRAAIAEAEVIRLREQIRGHAARIAQQSELLSRAAE